VREKKLSRPSLVRAVRQKPDHQHDEEAIEEWKEEEWPRVKKSRDRGTDRDVR
jgi:hypothetical protein